MTGSFKLGRPDGLQLEVLAYGAIIRALSFPDARGQADDLVLGFDTVEGYVANSAPYFGAVVGRYANRIAGARFRLGDRDYQLSRNNGANHLHGGVSGFDKKEWTVTEATNSMIELTLNSPDGDEGYPGSVKATVRYTLASESALRVEYSANVSTPTPINMSQHSYFNLSGFSAPTILDHELEISAERVTEIGDDLIPTGRFLPVDGTPFDFRKARRIGDVVNAPHPQMLAANGLDHNFILAEQHSASLFDPISGRILTVFSTEPGLQVYSGNFLDGTIIGKGGRKYEKHAGIALETQHFPDSPNHPHFPSVIVTPDREYISATTFQFGIK